MNVMPIAYLDALAEGLEHLDFDPGCEITNRHTDAKCGDAAAWWIIAGHHCRPDTTTQLFACEAHHQWIVQGLPVNCGTCRKPFNMAPRVIRTERLR